MNRDEARRKRDEDQRRENRKYGAPVNVATSWEDGEDERLRQEYGRGLDLAVIAEMHERGEMGIRERLVYLGLLDIRAGEMHWRREVVVEATNEEPPPFLEKRPVLEEQRSLFG